MASKSSTSLSSRHLSKESLESIKAEFNDHKIPLTELETKLQTSTQNGLTTAAAALVLKRDGLNRLHTSPGASEVLRFLKSIFQGFSILLWVGALLCFVLFAISAFSDVKYDYDSLYLGLVLILVVFITGMFSFYQEGKSSKVMKSFQEMVPAQANIIREGKVDTIASENLVVGDVVLLKFGDRIPADIRITESQGLKVDNSCLTGETEGQLRGPNCSDPNPLESVNMVFFSTFALEGTGRGIVVRTGQGTVMGHIAGLTSGITPTITPLGREIRLFMQLVGAWACILGAIFFIASLAMGSSWVEAIVFVIGIIVSNVPEGLLATVTLCLTLTSKRMAARNCLVKKLEAVETLGSTSIICSDKTGTLTQNRMTVKHFYYDLNIVEVFHGGQVMKKEAVSGTYKALCRCAILCNRAEFKPNQNQLPVMRRTVIGDASEAAILKCMEIATGGFVSRYRTRSPKVLEIPFNSTDKYQLSIHATSGEDYLVVVKGAPERVLDKCTSVLIKGEEVHLEGQVQQAIQTACSELAGLGERVLGLCDLLLTGYPPQHNFTLQEPNLPMSGFRFLGLVSLVDPPRPAVPDAIHKCRQAGIKVIMVTGDHPLTAMSIARKVGIISDYSKIVEDIAREKDVDGTQGRAVVVEGWRLSRMEDSQVDNIIRRYEEIVFARTSPKQKLQIVESCQRIGAIVGVTGDGVNDAPALKKANIGIAMGIAGSDVSKAAADMVLLNDDFSSIVAAIEEGRRIFDNLKKSIAYILASNVPEITPFLLHILLNIPLPLGVIAILLIDLGTDLIPAISLAHEKAESDIMSRPPRNPHTDHLVNGRLIFVAYGQIGVIEAAAGFFSYFVVMAENGFYPSSLLGLREDWDSPAINDLENSNGEEWSYASRKHLEYTCHTAFFVAIVLVQVADVLACKTRYNSILTQGMDNLTLNIGILFELALAAALVYIPGTGLIFKTYPLAFTWWLPALPFAVMLLLSEELRKYFIRRHPGGWVYREMYY